MERVVHRQLHQSAESSQKKTPPLQRQHQSPASSQITPFPFTLLWACPRGPIFGQYHSPLTKDPRGREGSLERADVWIHTEVTIFQCQPRQPAVPPVGNGSSTVILIKNDGKGLSLHWDFYLPFKSQTHYYRIASLLESFIFK